MSNIMSISGVCWLRDSCNGKDCDKPFCLRRYKLDALYSAALLSDTYKRAMVLNVDDDPVNDYDVFVRLANIEQHIEEFIAEGNNLFIHSSNCGNGKTSWAVRMIKSYLNKIWAKAELGCHALFISVPKLLIELKSDFGKNSSYVQYIAENIETAEIVVWDDIAAKAGTEYEIDRLFRFIDSRINLGKTNIYTTNLSAQELSLMLGERLHSRICEASIDIELKGSDKRKLQEESRKW